MIHIVLGESLKEKLCDIVQYVRQYGGQETLKAFHGFWCAEDEKGGVSFHEANVPATFDDLGIGAEYCLPDSIAWADGKYLESGENTDKYVSAYFSDLFDETLNINTTHDAFTTLNVCLYFPLYDPSSLKLAKRLINAINAQNRKIEVDVFVMTADMAKALLTDEELERLPERIEGYQQLCRESVKELLALKESEAGRCMNHLVVMQNCNNIGVSLNLDKDALVRTIGEYICTVQTSYASVFNKNFEVKDRPIHAFGVSVLNLDKYYFVEYLLTRAYLSLLEKERVGETSVNVAEPKLEAKERLSKWNHFYDGFYSDMVMPVINEKGAGQEDAVNVEASRLLRVEAEEMERDVLSFINNERMTLPQKRIVLAQMLGMDDPLVSGSSSQRDSLLFRDCYSDTIGMFVKANNMLLNGSPNGELYLDIPTACSEMKNIQQSYPEALCLTDGAVLGDERIPFETLCSELKATELKVRESTELIRSLEQQLHECEVQEDNALQKGKVLVEDGFRFGDVVYRLEDVEQIPLEETYEPKVASLPKSIDLRGGFNAIRNQGPLGSCTAFALSGLVEYAMMKGGKPNKDVSELYLFYYARYQEQQRKNLTTLPASKEGSSFFDAITALGENGICEETLWPYDPDKVDFCPSIEATEDAAKVKVVKAKNVSRKASDIKSALAEGYPVAVSLRLYESFGNNRHGFVELPSDEEIVEGRGQKDHDHHAMVVCGYRDDQNVFIVRNSWGKGFGDKGYCYMPYDYFEDEDLINMACIITDLNDMSDVKTDNAVPKISVSFDLENPNIRAGILRLSISVERRNLAKLSRKRAALYEEYAKIETKLVGGNVWAELYDATKRRLDWEVGEIDKQEKLNSQCESERLEGLKHQRNKVIIVTAAAYLVGIATYLLLWFKHIVDFKTLFTCKVSQWVYGFAAAGLVIFTIEMLLFRKRQKDIREEHDGIREKLSRLRHERTKSSKDDKGFLGLHLENLKVRMYQAWLVFKEFSARNRSFERKYQTMVSYVSNLQVWLEEEKRKIVEMSPENKFPFVSLLSNEFLDKYYEDKKDEILKDIKLSELFSSEYKLDDESIKLFKDNLEKRLVKALLEDLDGFSMSYCLLGNRYEYVGNQENDGQKLVSRLDQQSNPFVRQRYLVNDPSVGKGDSKLLFSNDISARSTEWHERFDGSITGTVRYEEIQSPYKLVMFQMHTLPLDECEDIR